MRDKLRALLGSSAIIFCAALFATPAPAQIIEQGALGTAQAYDPGALDFNSGGLDPALWQGTSATRAAQLLAEAPIRSNNPLIARMVRTVILTAGVPPTAKDAAAERAYSRARLRALMALGDPAALDNVVRRSPELATDPAVRADLALVAGDTAGACTMADSVTEGRGTPTWARLRAFCHVTRGELPAAELTVKLLRGSGYEDAVFYGLFERLIGASKAALPSNLGADPLYAVMADRYLAKSEQSGIASPASAATLARDPAAEKQARFDALFIAAPLLSDADIETIINGLIYDGVDVADLQSASDYDFESAKDAAAPLSFAQLFTLAKRGDVAAAASVLKAAESRGALLRFAQILRNELSAMAASSRADADLKLFARVAVLTDDIVTLQSLFGALEDGDDKARIAFTADAIGNGFRLGTLGRDIEDRLMDDGADGARAVRDALLALALGSTLSDTGAAGLAGASDSSGRAVPVGDLAILRAAAKAGSRAETSLRAAILLDGPPLRSSDFAAIIEALMSAQLTDFAGQLAGLDFLASL